MIDYIINMRIKGLINLNRMSTSSLDRLFAKSAKLVQADSGKGWFSLMFEHSKKFDDIDVDHQVTSFKNSCFIICRNHLCWLNSFPTLRAEFAMSKIG